MGGGVRSARPAADKAPQLPTRLPSCMQVLTAAPSPHRCAQHAQLPTRLPVLSLQQAQPLELTASHPALQSLLIAQAIGHGTLVSHLPELLNGRVAPPWQWGPQWAGTLLLGTTLGRPFSENLLRLGQVEAGPLPTCCMQVLTAAPSPHRWRQVRSQPACSAIGVRSSCPRATGQQPSKRSQGC